MTGWAAVVVGAGMCGLAACEPGRCDQRVVVLETGGVGAGQSAGLTRVFWTWSAMPRSIGYYGSEPLSWWIRAMR
jgi:hypothetical protein